MKIYPTLLDDSLATIQAQLVALKSLKHLSILQIDIIDGEFVDNLTITPIDLVGLDFGDLQLDFHLMVHEPLGYVYEILNQQETLPVRAIIAQVERMSDQLEFIREVTKNKAKAGLSLDVFTPIEVINDDAWAKLDVIQLMAVEAGFQGQPLKAIIFEKIKKLGAILTKFNAKCEIVIDGGVTLENVSQLHQVGADAVGVGSALWRAKDPQAVINQIRQL